MKNTQVFIAALYLLYATTVNAQTSAEVKLVAPLEEDRGWCLDLRGSRQNAAPIGGVHGHTCYTYEGNGVALDQGFFVENVYEANEFRMSGFPDLCMTLYEPNAGSFVSIETCDDRPTQDFVLSESGKIISEMRPELCLTVDDFVLPGGGGSPLHIMRDVSFEECDAVDSVYQTWELRSEWNGLEEATLPRPYEDGAGPAGPPGGMGAG
jgi:hypothetical protein